MTDARTYKGEIATRVRSWLEKNVLASRMKMFERVMFGKASPRTAIKAKCYECVSFEDIAHTVYECRSFTCPLWRFRPVASKAKDESTEA
jgi:hypothetical protein